MPTSGVDWSYSGDPASSDRDQVRFLVQDDDPELPWLTDAELDWLIGKWMPLYGSLTYVAAIAAALIARKVAGLGRISADGVDVDLSEMTTRFRQVAEDLRNEYAAEAEVGAAPDLTSILLGVTPDTSIQPLNFSIGMHDNPEAGWQHAGDWLPSLYPWVSEIVGA